MTRAHPREGTLRFDAAGRVAAGAGVTDSGGELQQRMQMRTAAASAAAAAAAAAGLPGTALHRGRRL